MPENMKAILLSGFGDADVMHVGEVPRPQPGPGQILIKVAAASVNRPDVVQREGNYPPLPGESEILGLEAAGTIESLGENVTGRKPGERVMALLPGGGYADTRSPAPITPCRFRTAWNLPPRPASARPTLPPTSTCF